MYGRLAVNILAELREIDIAGRATVDRQQPCSLLPMLRGIQ